MPLDKSLGYQKPVLSSDGLYAARGVLICLIVLGHVPGDAAGFTSLKKILYNFHVYLFLLISMLHPVREFSPRAVFNLAARYLLPVAVASFCAFWLFGIFVADRTPLDAASHLPVYLLAFLTGNYAHWDAATGLELFWFMYALIGLIVTRAFARSCFRSTVGSVAFLLVCAAISYVAVALIKDSVPAYLGVSVYFAVFGALTFLVFDVLSRFFNPAPGGGVLFVALFLALSLFWVPHHSYNLAHLRVPLFPWSADYLAHVLFVSSAFGTLAFFSEKKYIIHAFRRLGKNSIGIYLVHMFFLYPASLAAPRIMPECWMTIALIFSVALAASLLFSLAIYPRK
ncbi:MAG: acyltransferase family protein [Rhodovulum sp.]